MKKLTYKRDIFEHIWKKANEEQKSLLFYYSSFDLTSFEGQAQTKTWERAQETRVSLKDLIKKIDKHFFEKTGGETFLKSVWADYLAREIIYHELKKMGINLLFNDNSADVLVFENNNKIFIELKRLTTTKQLIEYVNGIKKKYPDLSDKKVCLLLLFPLIGKEDYARLIELVTGYYCIEAFSDLKILVCCVNIDNLPKIMEKIYNKIKRFK